MQYFNYCLEKKEETLRGVCFSPQKYTQVKTLEKTKSPVKLQHYKMSSSNDIIIDQRSILSPMEKIQFEMSNIITANDLSNIGSLMSVSANQLITLQAEVAHISQVKDMPTLNHGELKKQDVKADFQSSHKAPRSSLRVLASN